ncbi:MAG: M20/M25/M40 family metallo-hydrolase [Anaerolineales bacterium]|jgi:acetylornithine deacetylase/succinyl-diaminopimelate desuccinylase-like protein
MMSTPIEILQALIRFDTTNPPGNEYLAINWARDFLANSGIECTLLAKDPNRPNLIARLKGSGSAPPLLLQGHVDVVTTAGQDWKVPPFSAEIQDNFIWGRGTLDMKGAVAMMLSAFVKAHHESANLPGDVILCLLADEEASGNFGAKYLVEEHAAIFKDVRYALGEAGGFSLEIMGKTFFPIMVAEKQICWTKITLHGAAGHGSMIHRGGTMAQLGKILQTLDKKRLPAHITKPVTEMIMGIAGGLSFPANVLLKQLINPIFTDRILNSMGGSGKLFEPLFHNTVNATIVHASDKINVIPAEVILELDGRLLPGLNPENMKQELWNLLGRKIDIEIVHHDAGPSEPDMGLFPVLSDVLRKRDPDGHPIPFVMMAVTDARFFSKLGIQTYGFTPMQLPSDFKFTELAHAANERIPIDAVDFGTQAIYEVLHRFGEATI